MSCFSSLEELEGIAFHSPTARELAEKKVLQQRAEDEARRQEQLRIQMAEEEAKRKKAERIEQKRLEAEQRLQELAKKRAQEDEEEAERLRQLQIRAEKEEAERQARAREEERKQQEVKRAHQERLRREAEEAEKQRLQLLEAERQEKIRKRQQHQREQEISAEKRWLKIQAESGNVQVIKKDGVFLVNALKPGLNMDGMFSWLSQARQLEDIPYTVIETKTPAPQVRKPQTIAAPKEAVARGSLADRMRLKALQEDKENAKKALLAFEPKSEEQLRRGVGDILSQLDGPHRFAALLDLYTLNATMLAEHGVDGYQMQLQESTLSHHFARLPDLLYNFLEEAPGNIFVLSTLGFLQFAGSSSLRRQVMSLNAIPTNYKAWVGWIIGSRLFFEFLEWWNSAPGDEKPATPWTLRDETKLLAVPVPDDVKSAAKDKISQLIGAYLAPGMIQRLLPDLLEKLPFAYCRLDRVQDDVEGVLKALSGEEEIFGFETGDADNPEGLAHTWELQQYAVKDAQRAADHAHKNLLQLQEAVESARAFLDTSAARKSDLEKKLEALKAKEAQLTKERSELLKSIGQLQASV
eukprot:m.13511 g.13511  ORF g.13511 m.13511 type:complete len:581 (+) comp7293_c0_seq1:419-2161(+)